MVPGSADRAVALQKLRRQLAPIAPKTEERPPLPTGIGALDALLGGGLPRGRLTELVGRGGRMSCALAAIAAATRQGHLAALVDGPGALDGRTARDAGVVLDRLLWVRPRGPGDALRAADLILDVQGFALVVVSLCGLPPAGALEHGWLRLHQRCARVGAAMLVLGDRPWCGGASAATIELSALRAQWQEAPGARRVLVGMELRLHVLRSRLGPPCAGDALSLAR